MKTRYERRQRRREIKALAWIVVLVVLSVWAGVQFVHALELAAW